jgi:tetratricopeptide (TPR) repeat protein
VAHQWYGELLDYLARHEEAVAQMKRALELDPVSVPVMKNYGMILLHARKFTEAEAILRRTIEMDAKQPYLHLHLASTLAELGRYDEAIAECRIEAQGSEGPLARSGEQISELYVASRTGKKDIVAKHLAALEGAELLKLNAFLAAYVYGLAGVREKMYVELERAIKERARWTLMMNFSPAFDAYRKEERFQQLRKKIGFPD